MTTTATETLQTDADYGDCTVCDLPIGDVYPCSNHDLERCTLLCSGSCFCDGYVHPDCCPTCNAKTQQIQIKHGGRIKRALADEWIAYCDCGWSAEPAVGRIAMNRLLGHTATS